MTFEVFSRVGCDGVVLDFVRHGWGNYAALRGVRVENQDLKRRVADLEVRLQQEHALAARSSGCRADGSSLATVPRWLRVIAGTPTR